jgi:eukaryotic-like serine/threonine-protein kinase
VTAPIQGERYRLDELIGRGGMASVWRATDTVLGRPVAVKRLHPGLIADEEHAERFRREALLVARLSHSNLVRLLDRGEDADGPYLVMELVDGENLKSLVRREGALPPEEAVRICVEVGRALAYAHAQGVVHRDIKAQNVLLTREGGVKLTDFGIARLMEANGEPGLTRTDMLVGSADYLSPEQADGGPIDARTDVYSLGIVLYECLTGRLPFPGEGFVAVAMRHCSEPLPDPRTLAPAVPGWLAATAQRAAAKDPADRYPDAAAFVAALLSHDEPERGATAMMSVIEGDTERHRRPGRRRAVWLAALVALAALGGIAAIVVLGPGGGDSAPPAPAAGPLTLSSVQDFDPLGDGRERPDLIALANDHDPSTAWYTENYQDTPELGGLKEGVGLSLGLTTSAVATEMVIDSPTPGAKFQVLGPGSGIERETLAEGTLTGGEQVVPLTRAAPSGSYVLWFTSLVPDDKGGYWAGVGEVGLRGVPNSQ